MSKKVSLLVLILILLGGGFYLYATRPTKGPSETPDAMMEDDGTKMEDDGMTVEENEAHTKYEITSGNAEFRIGEVLRGEKITVIGATEDVSGSFRLDEEDLSASSFGKILVNARTLETPEENRNNMMRRFILKSEDDANEYIAFAPKQVLNLSGGVQTDEKIVFTMLGNLKIAGEVKPVSFDVEAMFTDEGTVEVRATGSVKYRDFGITIPEVPFVAGVEDTVFMVIEFTAERV